MRKLKIIITLLIIIAMVFSIAIVPSRAVFGIDDAVLASIGSWLLGYGSGKVLDYLIPKVSERLGKSEAVDHWHAWHTDGGYGGDREGNRTWRFKCSVCGETMEADPATVRFAYDDYVADLPATGYNSDGHLVWNPTLSDLNESSKYFSLIFTIRSNCVIDGSRLDGRFSSLLYFDPVYDSSRRALHVSVSPQGSGVGYPVVFTRVQYYLKAPVSGVYFLRSGVAASFSVLFDTGGSFSFSVPYENVAVAPGYSSGGSITETLNGGFPLGDGNVCFGDLYFYLPSYEIVPASTLEQYNINTRLSSVYGDVAYYDVDGNLQVSKNTTIVNEGDNYYYNPVTNNTYYVNNWNYDYSDRSYHLTTDTGDETTITYGDQYITIQEGDTIYNIYYYTDGAQLPDTHTHEWYQTGQKRATCTDYGTYTYTCYTCGEQKREVVPALGHAWLQRGYVEAEYDEDGELLEKAHVLYICSRCDEEYKDYDGVGPPETPSDGGDSSTDSSGILAWLKEFKDWLGDKLDALTGSGGGDVNIDNNYNITYTDDDGEEHDANIRDDLSAFDWWKDVADIGKTFVEQVSANEAAAYAYAADSSGGNPSGAPSIPINLSLAQSYYGVDYGGEVEMLDLSWYTPYKKTVDNLVSGFLWLAFFWALFRRAPSIISGAGLAVSRSEDIDDGRKNGRK